jgi:hypothetical protein
MARGMNDLRARFQRHLGAIRALTLEGVCRLSSI